MTNLDAWVVRRLLTGQEVNGEMQAVSHEFRPMAVKLSTTLPEDRAEAWERMLASRPDRDALVKALAEANPSGPAPEMDADEETDNGWEPMRLGSMPPAAPFPLDVLPDLAADLVRAGSAAIGCPLDFIAVSMLAVAGGAIGRSVRLRLKPNYFASACLYVACVGPPSNGKTPAFKLAIEGVRQIGTKLADEHALAMEQWSESNREEKNAKPPPKPRRIDVDDITMEAVPLRLSDNPRGLIMLRDELSALLLGMNQYKGGKGNDRATILKIWSGDAITRDRVNDTSGIPVRCPHPCLTILGGIPPDVLPALHDGKNSADGFVDRFLFAYPEPIPILQWTEDGIPEGIQDVWCDLVARVWQREPNFHEGKSVPHIAELTDEGKKAWAHHHNLHTAEMNAPDFPPSMAGPWGKLKEYAGRLALILACLEHAADPTNDPTEVPEVGPRTVQNAWRLVEYFKSHTRRAHLSINQGRDICGNETVRVLMGWIQGGNRQSFSESEFTQARRAVQQDTVPEALAFLSKRNVIRPKPTDTANRAGGRPPSPVYEVNPAFLLTRNP